VWNGESEAEKKIQLDAASDMPPWMRRMVELKLLACTVEGV
jgi:hypothetical protein